MNASQPNEWKYDHDRIAQTSLTKKKIGQIIESSTQKKLIEESYFPLLAPVAY